MNRVDLFTTIHKGVRVLLFDVATAAARVELASDQEVDVLSDRIEHVIDMIEDHEQTEHIVLRPILERIDARIGRVVADAHDEIEAAFQDVRRAARALAIAGAKERVAPSRDLHGAVSNLTVKCLAHLHHKETVVNAVLWGAFGDRELHVLRSRMYKGPASRQPTKKDGIDETRASTCEEWRAILSGVTTEAERASLFESIELSLSIGNAMSSLLAERSEDK